MIYRTYMRSIITDTTMSSSFSENRAIFARILLLLRRLQSAFALFCSRSVHRALRRVNTGGFNHFAQIILCVMYELKHISQIVRQNGHHIASAKMMPKCPAPMRRTAHTIYSIYNFKQVPAALRDGFRSLTFFGHTDNDYRLYPLIYWLALFMGLYGLVSKNSNGMSAIDSPTPSSLTFTVQHDS